MLEPLDVIKFICKDFWIAIFKKQIDKLQTNHRVRPQLVQKAVTTTNILTG